jgi:hypothetical protein
MRSLLLAVLLVAASLGFVTRAGAQSPTATPDPRIDPSNPLTLVFGPGPGGGNPYALSDLTGVPLLSQNEAIARLPRLAAMLPPGMREYTLQGAYVQIAPGGRFSSRLDYGDGVSKVLRIHSYTKSGDFLLRGPANSPVSDIRHATLTGFPALTWMPTPAVVGGAGPREVYFLAYGVITRIEFDGFSENAEALEIAERIAADLRSRAPGSPATGSGSAPGHGLDGFFVIAGSLVLFGIAAAAFAAWPRR